VKQKPSVVNPAYPEANVAPSSAADALSSSEADQRGDETQRINGDGRRPNATSIPRSFPSNAAAQRPVIAVFTATSRGLVAGLARTVDSARGARAGFFTHTACVNCETIGVG
jgi:hypothetical protein